MRRALIGRTFIAVLSGLLAASSAAAETIITFDPGKGENTGVTMIGPAQARGTWVEKDYRVGWYYDNDGDIQDGYLPNVPFRTLAVGAYGEVGAGMWLNLKQKKGKPLSLLSLGVDHTLALYVGGASFTPYDSNGNLDDTRVQSGTYNIRFDDLLLTGIRRTGEIVAMTVSSFGAASIWETLYDIPTVVGDGLVQLDDAGRALFSDLVSLRVEANWPREFAYQSSILADPAIDPIFKRGAELCSGQLCDVPGLGQFSFWEDYLLDVPAYTTIGGFVVEETDVAPVPLDRSVLFLLVGLAALAVMSLARRTERRSSLALGR